MKKCQICGKPASMFLTQIVNGQVTELAFCEECAKAKGLFDPQSLTFAEKFFPEQFKEKLDSLMRELSQPAVEGNARQAAASANMLTECPTCHFTLEDFRRSERLGCPDCYTVFAQELTNAPSAAPGEGEGEEETGRTPGTGAETPRPPSLIQLRTQLQEAIEREDYETAAKLRDQIKKLS